MSIKSDVCTREEFSLLADYLVKEGKEHVVHFMTFIAATLRRGGDVLACRFDDIKGNRWTVKEEKTGKVRTVTLNADAMAVVKARRAANPKAEYLFQSPRTGKAYTRAAMNKQMIAARRALEAEGKLTEGRIISAHSFRKMGAKHLYTASNNNIALVQYHLNHSSSAVTLCYLGVADEQIDHAMDSMHLLHSCFRSAYNRGHTERRKAA